jgi:hypothetical protein
MERKMKFSKLFLFISVGVIFSSNIFAAPISITIEDNSGISGVKAEKQVDKIYEHRKKEIEANFAKVKKEIKDPEEMSLVILAHDSVDCMDRSVASFPLLIDIIDGQKMDANNIAKIMENNCVLDVLVHVKRDLPEKLDKAKDVYKKLGFTIPEDDLEGF